MNGVIYLLHFDSKYKHAGHYIGYSENLAARLDDHRSGTGGRLVAVARGAGIGFKCVRTWIGTRSDERKLKNRKNAGKMCPVCNAKPEPVKMLEEIPLTCEKLI